MTDVPKRPDSRQARASRGPTRIGKWTLYPDIGVLRDLSTEVRLNPKTLHVLLVLLDADDKGVSRDALLDQVWGENYPSDGVISRAMADLRAAFGETAGEQKYIRTLPKFGYQFVADHSPVDQTSQPAGTSEQPTPRENRVWYVVAAGVALAAVWFSTDMRNTDPIAASSVAVLSGQRPLTSAPGLEHQPRFVKNSEWIVYAVMRASRNDWDLFRVSSKDNVSQPVAVTPGVHEHGPAISPSGEELAYVRISAGDCDVVVQSITLGVPEKLAACTTKFATLVDWSPSDSSIAYTAAQSDEKDSLRRIYAVDRFSGDTRALTSAVSATGTDFYPRFSPSGEKLAFLRGEPQPDHRTTLWVVDISSGEERQLTRLPAQTGGMTWLDENRLLYSTSDGGRMRGRWIDISDGESHPIESAEFVHPEYSIETGRLAAVEPRNDSDLSLLTADGNVKAVARSTGDDHHGTLSPNEEWVAFISRRSGSDELWIAETDGELLRRLTRFDGAAVRYPDWHADGQRILFTVQTDAGEKLYEVDIVSGTPKRIETSFEDITTPRWRSDGRNWVAGCRDADGWGICVGDGLAANKILKNFYRPRPSADGRVYVVDSAGSLFELSVENATVQEVWDGLPGNGRFAWTVENDSIFLLSGAEGGNLSRMFRRDIKSGDIELLYEGRTPLADMTLSIGKRSGAILFTGFQTSSDDLVIYERALIN